MLLNKLPTDYSAIPLQSENPSAFLKLGVVISTNPDPVGGYFVIIRETMNTVVYLGCVQDNDGTIHQWLEIWVQNNDTLIQRPASGTTNINNALLDTRWKQQVASLSHLCNAGKIHTPYEQTNPLPLLIDPKVPACKPFIDPQSQQPWQLCTDDELLSKNELPTYSTSLDRYLYLPDSKDHSQFIPATPLAPENNHTVDAAAVLGEQILFNPACGMLFIKPMDCFDLESFIDYLQDQQRKPLWHGGQHLPTLTLDDPDTTDAYETDGLFTQYNSIYSRLTETFYLKLALLSGLLNDVSDLTAMTQCPLLNLKPDSFSVNLQDSRNGLPSLWTFQTRLVNSGHSIRLGIGNTQSSYFLPGSSTPATIYSPTQTGQALTGSAEIRLRHINADNNEAAIIEGTMAVNEPLNISGNDIVWLKVNLQSGPVVLYAKLESDTALTVNEWRFRTLPDYLDSSVLKNLKAAEGIPIRVSYEVLTGMGFACDLYSLGVLALRIFFVDESNSLPVAIDEILSLKREIESSLDYSDHADQILEELFTGDPRWIKALGPDKILAGDISAQTAIDYLTPHVWFSLVAIILKLFPGNDSDSLYAQLSDISESAINEIYRQLDTELKNLMSKTKNLIVSDLFTNKQIVNLIDTFIK